MSARELITEHLDWWAGAVTKKSSSGRASNGKVELTGIKKLRELILELAVRGSLVEQDPGDESAQELLEQCLKAKTASVELGKLKKTRKHSTITSDDIPFDLPQGWVWSRLDDLVRVINGRAYKKHEMLSSGTPLLRVGNLFTSNDWYYSDLELEKDKYIDSGDLIYAWSASFGPFIWDGGRAIYHYHIWKLDLFDGEAFDKLFLYLYLKAITEEIKSSGSGIAMVHMTKAKMEELIVPVPPLEEQHRIVQKVDELMALCDRLEQQTSDQLEAHETLVDTLLATLNQSENATELADNWARLASHFDTLFTTEHSIDKLKQTILQLAVMGRLVEQDAGDVHAKELVAAATQVRESLIRKGKLKKPRKSKIPNEDERFHRLPYGWSRVKVYELFQLQNGYAFKSSWFAEDGPRLLRNVNISHGYVDWSNSVSLPESMAVEFARFELKEGDIVISLDRPLISTGLKYAIIRECDLPCLLLQRVALFRQYSDIVHTGYLQYWLNSEMFTSSIDPGRSNGVPHISTGQIEALNFPLPPKEEQNRIVQKVDELMALCDQLKERLSHAGETRCQMAEAIVEQGLSA